MKKYVQTSLNDYLNESKTITLKRKYANKDSVVVGTNAPLRNKVLAYVNENIKVKSRDLRKFISEINESETNSTASISMWLKRNKQFFITESKNDVIFFKLSPIGKRLANKIKASLNESEEGKKKTNKRTFLKEERNPISKRFQKLNEEEDEKSDHDFVDTSKGYARKGIYDDLDEKENCDEGSEDSKEEKMDEAKQERIKRIIENIKEQVKSKKVNESDEQLNETDDEDELTFDDIDLDDDEGDDSEGGDSGEGSEEGEGDDDLGGEGDDDLGGDLEGDDERVEISDFIITVDDADAAIAELAEIGVDAEKVEDEESEEEAEEDTEEDLENAEEDTEEAEEELEGGEEKMDEAEEFGGDDDNDHDDLGGEEGGQQIKVSVDNWDALKGWLEEKGVDIEETFGGEIEVEDETISDEGGDFDMEGEGDDDLGGEGDDDEELM